MYERLQKALSEYGVMSRRAAEKLIDEGKITINGTTARPGQKIDPETDVVEINGKEIKLKPQKAAYIMLNKPAGYITSVSDEKGRKTVMDLLYGIDFRVFPVGRLDYDSEGLLILTNDGSFANTLMHPSNQKEKTYVVKVSGFCDTAPSALGTPLEIDGHIISPARVELLEHEGNNAVLKITIHEGRNRQIRKMCASCGLSVISLKRISIGGVSLGDLEAGKWRYLTDDEVHLLIFAS